MSNHVAEVKFVTCLTARVFVSYNWRVRESILRILHIYYCMCIVHLYQLYFIYYRKIVKYWMVDTCGFASLAWQLGQITHPVVQSLLWLICSEFRQGNWGYNITIFTLYKLGIDDSQTWHCEQQCVCLAVHIDGSCQLGYYQMHVPVSDL